MRRRVAICNFNLTLYSRWEGQEGVGMQGGNATIRTKSFIILPRMNLLFADSFSINLVAHVYYPLLTIIFIP